LQEVSRAPDARADGVDRDRQLLGDLAVALAAEREHLERGAQLRRQLTERLEHGLGRDRQERGDLLGFGDVVGHLVGQRHLDTPAPAQQVTMVIAQDPEQPAADVPPGQELGARLPRPLQRRLHQVFRVLPVATKPPRRPLQRRPVPD